MSCPCNSNKSLPNRYPGINRMPSQQSGKIYSGDNYGRDLGSNTLLNPNISNNSSSIYGSIPKQSPISVNRNNVTGVSLPFGVRYFSTSNNFNQEICVNQMSLLPNGPVIPTAPIMPSALPPVQSGGFTSVNTQYLCVRKIANICNLQGNQVIIDSGRKNSTSVILANLPEVSGDTTEGYYQLVVTGKGKILKFKPNVSDDTTKTKSRRKTGNTDDYFSADMYTKLISMLSKQSNDDSSNSTPEPPIASGSYPPNLPANLFGN